MNMGGWNFVFPHLLSALPHKTTTPTSPLQRIKYAGRPVSASPAVASVKLHESQQARFLSEALRIKIQPQASQ